MASALPRLSTRIFTPLILFSMSASVFAQADVAAQADQSFTVAGHVFEESGNPAAHVEVLAFKTLDDKIVTTTDAQGAFALTLPIGKGKGIRVVAQRGGGREQGMKYVLFASNPEERQQLKITLEPTRKVVVRVVDAQQRPVEGATVAISPAALHERQTMTDASGTAILYSPRKTNIQCAYAVKNDAGFDYRSFDLSFEQRSDRKAVKPQFPDEGITLRLDGTSPLTVTLKTAEGQPIPDTDVYIQSLKKSGEPQDFHLTSFVNTPPFPKTDAAGTVKFPWIPRWQKSKMMIGIRTGEYDAQRTSYDPTTGNGTLEISLHRLVPIRGRVVGADGMPAANATVQLAGSGYSQDAFRGTVQSREDGTFEIKAAPNQVYLIVASQDRSVSDSPDGFILSPDTPVENIELRLRPATKIHGRVTVGVDQKPVKGMRILGVQYGVEANDRPELALPNPEKIRRWIQPSVLSQLTTDSEGFFEQYVGRGKFQFRGPTQSKAENFEITDEVEKEINFHMPRPEKGILKGLVQAGEPPQPVAGAIVSGVERGNGGWQFNAVTDESGRFEVERNLWLSAIHVLSKDGSLGSFIEVPPDDVETIITLQPTGSAFGTLVDSETEKPLANQSLTYGTRIIFGEGTGPFRCEFGGPLTTDDAGRFSIPRLVQGLKFEVNQPTTADGYRTIITFPIEGPDPKDLGTITVKPFREYRPPTLEDRILATFTHKLTPVERFDAALSDARLSRMRVMILFADPKQELTRQFMKLRLEDDEVRPAFDDYRVMAVKAVADDRPLAQVIASRLGQNLPEAESEFLILTTDAEGQLLEVSRSSDLLSEGVIDKQQVLALLKKRTQPPLDAQQLYDEALAQAKRENKRVILQETATWCGPCWMLSRFLNKHRAIWDRDYIWVKMDHRWTGARDLMKPYRGTSQGGVPWWLIVDADGKPLITSNTDSGPNIGFPSDPDGISHFEKMMQKTAQHMSPEDIALLVGELKKAK